MAIKILVVDDSPTIRQIITIALRKQQYDITTASDGLEGLTAAQGAQFDVIICDLNMPNMNGFEMITKVKSLPNYQKTPIFMLTTETSKESLKQGKSIGITAWCTKPIKPENLIQYIDHALKM